MLLLNLVMKINENKNENLSKINEKAKIAVQNVKHSVLVKRKYLKYSEMRSKFCFKWYNPINRTHKTFQ